MTTLEEIGREPNRILRSGRPILTELIRNDAVNAEGVRYLLSKGADPFLKDGDGNLAVHAAALFNKREILDVLLEACGKEIINTPNNRGVMLLHIATFNGYHDMARMLIDAGAYLNEKNEYGSTPLFGAVAKMDVKMVRLLIDAGADIIKYEQAGGESLLLRLERSAFHVNHKPVKEEIAQMLKNAGAKTPETAPPPRAKPLRPA